MRNLKIKTKSKFYKLNNYKLLKFFYKIKKTLNKRSKSIISITDLKGNVISWSSCGGCGFKGSRKGTPFAAQIASTTALKKAIEQGIKQVEINISGPGSGRETAIRAIASLGIGITSIRDVTSIPHNGCRPPKKRRI